MARLSERLRRRRPPANSSPRAPDPVAPAPGGAEPDGLPARERDLRRESQIGRLGSEERLATRVLYERLAAEDIAEAERLMRASPEFEPYLPVAAEPAGKRMLTLHCAMWHRLDSAAQRTGLSPRHPPEEIHAMARGPLAAAGALYEADLIADALVSAGVSIGGLQSGLDFGCSSGRVVRVLAAAFPGVRWLGCDPNAAAVQWGQGNLSGIEFFVSHNEPPLALDAASLELAFAISIWSHFEPRLGLQWFDEMRRLLKPGGYLVLTTHGLTSVSLAADTGARSPGQCEEITEALYRRGWWYASEFGPRGDWGVVNPAWGTSFLSTEWLLSELCPSWRVLEFAPGRLAANQDVYVLQRA